MILNQGRTIDIVIVPCFCHILQYGPIKIKEVGKWGVGENFNVRTNHNQQLDIGMDRSSVYDNEN